MITARKRLGTNRIDDRALAGALGAGRGLRGIDAAGAEEVVDLVSVQEQLVGDDAAVVAPPDRPPSKSRRAVARARARRAEARARPLQEDA